MEPYTTLILFLRLAFSNFSVIDQTLLEKILQYNVYQYPISHLINCISTDDDFINHPIDFRLNYFKSIPLHIFNYTAEEQSIIAYFLLTKSIILDEAQKNTEVYSQIITTYLNFINNFQATPRSTELNYFYNSIILFTMQLLGYNQENYNNGTILTLSNKLTLSWQELINFDIYARIDDPQ